MKKYNLIMYNLGMPYFLDLVLSSGLEVARQRSVMVFLIKPRSGRGLGHLNLPMVVVGRSTCLGGPTSSLKVRNMAAPCPGLKYTTKCPKICKGLSAAKMSHSRQTGRLT